MKKVRRIFFVQRERDKQRNRLLTTEKKLMVVRGEMGCKMGNIGDGN